MTNGYAVYDQVRQEREQQREILQMMHTPRSPAAMITGQNDRLYYEQKQWEHTKQLRLEQKRALKSESHMLFALRLL